MTTDEKHRRIHELSATLRVGKGGIEPVVEELADQVADRGLVKVKLLRSARGEASTEQLAEQLGERAGVTLVQTRGHTAVYEG